MSVFSEGGYQKFLVCFAHIPCEWLSGGKKTAGLNLPPLVSPWPRPWFHFTLDWTRYTYNGARVVDRSTVFAAAVVM